MKKALFFLFLSILLLACDATKRMPDGAYLLDKVNIDANTKSVSSKEYQPYLRQKPNSSFLKLRYRLLLYNLAGTDSSWVSRQLRKIGERPVLYSNRLTEISMQQLKMYAQNRGYLNAEVDTTITKEDKKAKVTYLVEGHDAYKILQYKDTIQDTAIVKILKDKNKIQFIKKNNIFDLERLDEGRMEMARTLRNNGYYNFSKDNFYFLADTTVGTHQVSLKLGLNNPTDSTKHQQHYIGNVKIINGIDAGKLADSLSTAFIDTTDFRDISVLSDNSNQFLRNRALYYNSFLRRGRLYSDRGVERTYSSLNGLGAVSQTSINLVPVVRNDSNFLDAEIAVVPGNIHWIQFGVDGTNSNGDLGVATNLTYEHRNIFRGAEKLRIRLNGAYEFIRNAGDSSAFIDQSYYEYGTEIGLNVPQLLVPWLLQRLKEQPSASTDFSVGINYQKRPEYLRQFFNLSSKFQWSRMDLRLTNIVEPLDINYVRMPWVSDNFRNEYLSDSSNVILRSSYEDQLIARTAYTIAYTNSGARNVPKYPFRVRARIDVAGLLPRLVTALNGSKTNNEGYEEILGIRYAEYVKSDFDIAYTFPLNEKNTLATHLGIGVAYPYGNSIVLPFEKRYYGGGANHVRGWSTRTLGPGSYFRSDAGSDFVNKTGDINLILSTEYRHKLTKLFELATFVDAGNIWTIKDYASQHGGYFRFKDFYKQIAMAYGLGLRLDLNFLLLRADFAMKAHNPALESGSWTIFKPKFSRDFAFHFAIGYPF